MSASQATEGPAPTRGRRPLQAWPVGRRMAAPGLLGLVGLAAVAQETAAAAEGTHVQVRLASAVEQWPATTSAIARGVADAEGVPATARRLASAADVLLSVVGRFRVSSSSSDAVPLGAGR